MEKMNKVNTIKVAVDAIGNKVKGNFSSEDTLESLRAAFIDANGGSNKLDIRTFHRGNELFEIVQDILPYITNEGLTGNEFFMSLVDYKNIALGDQNEFWLPDNSTFLVSTGAAGTQAIRRQRLNVGEKTDIKTSWKYIKVYEELDRLLSGRINFDEFVTKVGEEFVKKANNDIYTVFSGISSSTSGMNSTYYKSGSFDEEVLIALIDHLEAATGKTVKIIGARTALRKVATAVISNEAKSDMYNAGFYGKFNGTDMIVVKQAHTAGTDTFVLDADKIFLIASDDKPIKFVNEGTGFLSDKDPMANADLTQEYMYGQKYGLGLIINGKLGIYDIA